MTLFEKQELSNVQTNKSIIIQAGGNVAFDEILYNSLLTNYQNPKLYNRLIKEKVDLCKNYILNKDIDNLKVITDTVFNYGLNGVDDEFKQILYFYRYILAIFNKDNNSMEDCIDNLEGRHHEEAEILLKFQKEPYLMVFDEYCSLFVETQLVILDILFDRGLYNNIEALYLDNIAQRKNVADILNLNSASNH